MSILLVVIHQQRANSPKADCAENDVLQLYPSILSLIPPLHTMPTMCQSSINVLLRHMTSKVLQNHLLRPFD